MSAQSRKPVKKDKSVVPNPVGRPPKFSTVDQLQKAIDEYFDYCDNRIQQIYSKKTGDVIEVINPEPYTMAGLAYHMGIDRDTLINYSKRDKFIGAIKRARDKVHMDVERRLMEDAPTGAIFNLKNNFGWKDKSEIENTHKVVTPILGGKSKHVRINDSDQKVIEA